ncbi:MAG TPA: FAD-dependent oxidoreductase [Pyrinomonadaceae bacterium]|jgi:monoamine oxidase
MKRREFLQNSLLAAASLLLSSKISSAQVSIKPKKILIVGAGLSGLVAAYELNKLGHDVSVFEAQSHGGGRVLTFRGFDKNLYADAGAARIFHTHDLTHRYVKEFNLSLLPFYPKDGRFSRFNNDKVERVGWDKFAEATDFVMVLEKEDYWQKIKGGNDLLPRAFAERLADKIRYDAPVLKIEQNAGEVSVTFAEKGTRQTIKGDFLISAIPLTMLRKIEVAPKFTDERTKIITQTTYDSASRVFLQTKKRFWLAKNLNGFGFGEGFAEIWNSTFGQEGRHGILQSYTRSLVSMLLTEESPAQRIDSTINNLEKFFPELRVNFEKGFSKCWSEDEWAKGAWTHLTQEQMSVVVKPENRIFFAGEHVSGFPSWMQGALQSGLRVVDEINNAKITPKV